MTPLLVIEGLDVEGRIPGGGWTPTVRDVRVTVHEGEVLALIGESGAGKTTLGLAALGYFRPGTRPVRGRVLYEGSDLLRTEPAELKRLRGAQIAYVAQSAAAALNPALALGRQVAEPLRIHGRGDADVAARVVALFRRLGLPEPEVLSSRYPHQVSGGQQQRVMLAMAMVCAPRLIVFDEPTTALDVTTQVGVLGAIKEALAAERAAGLYVSHDLAVVAQVADRIVVMRRGEIVEQGPTAQLLAAPAHDYTRALLAAVRSKPTPGTSHVAAPCIRKGGKPLLELSNVRASYDRRQLFGPPPTEVLHGVSLAIARGEVVALVGESGSGKSTVARVAAGLLAPLSGSVHHDGVALAPNVRERSRAQLKQIQLVVQSPDLALNPAQRVREILRRPLALYLDLDPRDVARRIGALLEMVELPASYAERFPRELSGGQRQRVSLARALAAEPSLLLCDEVLSSLDTIVAKGVLDLLKDLRHRLGVGYLFISHDLATVAELADRVIVLHQGMCCEEGEAAALFAAPRHPYTRRLIDSIPELRPGWLEETIMRDRARA